MCIYIYIYVYLVKRVKVGWQFFRGLATLDAAPLRWTKSGWQRWTFGEHHDHKLFGRWGRISRSVQKRALNKSYLIRPPCV